MDEIRKQFEASAMALLTETSFKGGAGGVIAVTDDEFQHFRDGYELVVAAHQRRAVKTTDGRLIVEPLATGGWVSIPWEPEATLIQRFAAERDRVRSVFEKRGGV
jgi:hypothetical protein